MIHGNRSPSPWLSKKLNLKIKNPRSPLPTPCSPLQAHMIAFPVRVVIHPTCVESNGPSALGSLAASQSDDVQHQGGQG
jgi:hypothetical protein